METKQVQQALFRQLKQQLPSHISLADELAELLSLSADSVYRRIRGEKPVTLSELKLIGDHYHLSIDQLLSLDNDSVHFQAPGITNGFGPFATYMKGMLAQFNYFNSFQRAEIRYLSKDTPFWYFYLFPEMAAFKTFFWSKTINNEPSLADSRFSLQEFPFTDCFDLGQQILEQHCKMSTIELWNLESIHSTINQIAYYRDTGLFTHREDLLQVIDAFIRMLDHLQAQASKGIKFMPGGGHPTAGGAIQFYINELILGNNTILLTLDDQRLSMVTYSVFGYLITRDDRFTGRAFDTFNTLLSRSALVSKSGEKERNKFFNVMKNKVNELKQ